MTTQTFNPGDRVRKTYSDGTVLEFTLGETGYRSYTADPEQWDTNPKVPFEVTLVKAAPPKAPEVGERVTPENAHLMEPRWVALFDDGGILVFRVGGYATFVWGNSTYEFNPDSVLTLLGGGHIVKRVV